MEIEHKSYWHACVECEFESSAKSGADSGFSTGGGADPREGASTYAFAKISKKLHEIEKILGRRWVLPKIRQCKWCEVKILNLICLV